MLLAIKLENVFSRETWKEINFIKILPRFFAKLKNPERMLVDPFYEKFLLASSCCNIIIFCLECIYIVDFPRQRVHISNIYTCSKMKIIAKLFAFLLTFSTKFPLKMEASMYPIISQDITQSGAHILRDAIK